MKSLLLSLCLLTLTACSHRAQDIQATVVDGIWGMQDANMTFEQIAQLPYASAYVRINDGAQLFMVLGYADQSPAGDLQLKWISADSAMIVTENGRITKTLKLPNSNLAGITYTAPANFADGQVWTAIYDWQQPMAYGFHGAARVSFVGEALIQTPSWQLPTKHYLETIAFSELSAEIQNQYWVDANQRVVKSIQYTGPEMHKIEITYLKFFEGAKP